ncbi:MAG TPA: HEAT repeat domain-containing protein, partial [Terracidiphilus sp.]
MNELITQDVIDNCEHKHACDQGLNWLRRKPRTYVDLRNKSLDWFRRLAQYSTIPTVLEKLATDSDADVRWNVAYNAHTPVVVLEKLATDSDADVRRNVAYNAHTPVVVLEKLATDSDADVR